MTVPGSLQTTPDFRGGIGDTCCKKSRCTVVFGGLCTIGTGHRADFVRSGHNAAPMLHTRFPVERQGKQCLNSPPRSRHLRTDSPALPPRHAISFLLHHTLAYMTPRTPASESHPSRPPFPLWAPWHLSPDGQSARDLNPDGQSARDLNPGRRFCD